MNAEDQNNLLDSSILTNDESGDLDPAVLAQFKAYEKAIAALTAQVKNLTQRLDNQNSTEQSGLPNGPTVSTAADTNTSTGSSTTSNVSSTLTTHCYTQSTCSSCTNAYWPRAASTQLFNPQAQVFIPHSHSLPPKCEPSCTEECKTHIGPLHQDAPAPSAPALGDLHNSSEMHSAHNHPVASGNYPHRIKPLFTDMPTFWQHYPQLWFDTVDSKFSQNRITNDQAKFLAVFKHLGSHICKTISPVLRSLPATDKYCRLKDHLVKKFAPSTQQKIDSLLKECKLGDKKPSELFTEMDALGQGHVPHATILLFWYRLLPNDMAIQLDDAVTPQDAQSAVEKADRIHQRLRFPDSHISAITSHDTLDDARLNQITEHLSDKILAVIESKTKPRQNRSSDSSGSHQRARSQSRTNFGPNKDLCFYHSKYKNKAEKCPDKSCAASKYEKEWLAEEKSKKSS
ncbi:hypothetical protein TKK_0016541 [Trichogramma kaykai]|uniref:DUF7041 domain-containing protein n=1 Tax=Trichogramma kaykai TaxID=54128 RepID=A0ABD2W6K3_9HYME